MLFGTWLLLKLEPISRACGRLRSALEEQLRALWVMPAMAGGSDERSSRTLFITIRVRGFYAREAGVSPPRRL